INCQASISEKAHPDGRAFLRLRERGERLRNSAGPVSASRRAPTDGLAQRSAALSDHKPLSF
ncbi:hypothetical protein ACGHB7_001995, partial [Salmonella enterica]